MLIEISNKEILTIRRLGNAMASNIVPVGEVKELLTGLQRKISTRPSAASGVKRNNHKDNLVIKYKAKIKS